MTTDDSSLSPQKMVSLGIAAATRAWDCFCAPVASCSVTDTQDNATTSDPTISSAENPLAEGVLVGGDGLTLSTAELQHALGIWEENDEEEVDVPQRNANDINNNNKNSNVESSVCDRIVTVKRKYINSRIFQIWKALFSYGLITVDDLGDALDRNSVKELFVSLVEMYGNPKKICPPVWTKPIAPCEAMWREQLIVSSNYVSDKNDQYKSQGESCIVPVIDDVIKVDNEREGESSSMLSSRVALRFASIHTATLCNEYGIGNNAHTNRREEEKGDDHHKNENITMRSVPAIPLRNMRHFNIDGVGSYGAYQVILTKAITEGKNAANSLFMESKYSEAIRVYKEALVACGEAPFAVPLRPVISVIYSNISQSELNLREFAKARRAASTALKFNPENEKAKARMQLAESKLMSSLDTIDKEARAAGLRNTCGGQ